MNVQVKKILLSAVVLAATAASTLPAAAFMKPRLIVQNLPAADGIAPAASQDLFLRTDRGGNTFLYVEQQQGALLSVFDVTDPDHMKLIAAVPTQVASAYNFVGPIGAASELIAFRDGSGTAVIDLRKPKAPRLSAKIGAGDPSTEALGSVGYLSSTTPQGVETAEVAAPVARSVQLVEGGAHPRVVANLPRVTRQVERPETGTVFLLSDDQVTIIRRPEAESEYEVNQLLDRNQN
jgi:hypothetical protein